MSTHCEKTLAMIITIDLRPYHTLQFKSHMLR